MPRPDDLFYYLMNTLLQIKHYRHEYCFCNKNEQICQLCVLAADFIDFEENLNNNMMDLKYLKNYNSKLYPLFLNCFVLGRNLCVVF